MAMKKHATNLVLYRVIVNIMFLALALRTTRKINTMKNVNVLNQDCIWGFCVSLALNMTSGAGTLTKPTVTPAPSAKRAQWPGTFSKSAQWYRHLSWHRPLIWHRPHYDAWQPSLGITLNLSEIEHLPRNAELKIWPKNHWSATANRRRFDHDPTMIRG